VTTFEDQFAALFGKSVDGKSITDKKFIKYENPGETFYFVITGEMERTPQTMQVGGVDRVKVLVRVDPKEKMKPFPIDAVPEGTDEKDIWQPPGDVTFPVKVVKHTLVGGKPDEEFEEFDTKWELRAGNRMEKLQEAMLEAEIVLEPGVRVIEKLLDKNSKPYKYSIKVAPPK
jgi:hypothetical protein